MARRFADLRVARRLLLSFAMRIDPRQVSTQHKTGKSWGPAADAPTFLPSDEVVIPLRAPKSDSVVTSAPKRKPEVHSVVSRGASQSTIKPAKQQSAAQLPVTPSSPPPATGAPVGAPQAAVPPFVAFDGGASYDPLAIPLPPDLAPPVYGWLRRLALQADLVGADRLLRDALADLTSALNVMIIYAGADGLHSIGSNDELPKDTQPIVAVARSRRALVGTHSALIPITTTTETIAVIQLVRNVRQPAFNMVDYVTMAAIARESASIMHHLVAGHLQRRTELEQDKKSLYRPEALDNHRRRGQEGSLTELSPGWVRRTYHVLVVGILVAIVAGILIHVPTYSTGTGVVVFNGTPVTSPAPGTVDTIYVASGEAVKKGAAVVKLKADKEESDLRQARTELEAALQSYLFDPSDETIRKSLVSAQAAAKRAEDALEQRTVRAPKAGTISDIRIRTGAALQFGDAILSIVEPGTEPELWAYLPGSDRPRLRAGQMLQVELSGYQKTREMAKIYDVGRDIIGAAEARRTFGPELADSLKLAQDGSYVLVKAKLPRRTFRAKGKEYRYHQGMPSKVEVRVEDKRFIVTLLPSLETYIE
jgi:membrane fusion protein (multidrug efflux system)